MTKNAEKVEEILKQNKQFNYFYNSSFESAVKVAIDNKAFEIYDILLSHGIRLGPHESLDKIYQILSESNKEKIRDINFKHIISADCQFLYRNSYLSHDSTNPEQEFEYIKKAYKILSQIPMIAVIMKVVEASKNFHIIFDFNRNSVAGMDPTACNSMKGLYYTSGVIYIGAQDLLKPETEFDVLGCLAHQLCHFALNLVYKNYAKPYKRGDKLSKMIFSEIAEVCRMNCHEDEVINFAFDCYSTSMQHAELIVRVPQLIVIHLNNPAKFEDIKKCFDKLFEYFEQKVVADMIEAIPMVQMKGNQQDMWKDKIIKILAISLIIILIVFFIFVLK